MRPITVSQKAATVEIELIGVCPTVESFQLSRELRANSEALSLAFQCKNPFFSQGNFR
jgi:hypothetical protein